MKQKKEKLVEATGERKEYKFHPLLLAHEQEKLLVAFTHLSETWWDDNALQVMALMTWAVEDVELEITILRIQLWCRLYGRAVSHEWELGSDLDLKSSVGGKWHRKDLKDFKDTVLQAAKDNGWDGKNIPCPKTDIKWDGNWWSFIGQFDSEIGVRIRALCESLKYADTPQLSNYPGEIPALITSGTYLENRYRPQRWTGYVKAFYESGVSPDDFLAFCLQACGAIPFPDALGPLSREYAADVHGQRSSVDKYEWCDSLPELLQRLQDPEIFGVDALCVLLNADGLGAKCLQFFPEGVWADLAYHLLDSRCRSEKIKQSLMNFLPLKNGCVVRIPKKKEFITYDCGDSCRPINPLEMSENDD